jgi:dolichol-phosphate hexosyltransferase
MRLTVAVPVYNERERVASALKALLAVSLPVDAEIPVVDDGSRDGTFEVLEGLELPSHVRLIRHDKNGGKGKALRTALENATGDAFVPFDADLEYDPADLAQLLAPMVNGDTDVVYGTRAFSSHTSYSFWFVMGNKLLNLWTNVLFDCYISDLETCYKLVRTSLLRSLELTSSGFDIEAEITAKLLRRGHRPYEIPISYAARSRAQGKKISWRDGLTAVRVITRTRFAR